MKTALAFAMGLFAMFALTHPAAAGDSAERVEPVVLIDDQGTINACGVRAVAGEGHAATVFELLVRRAGDAAILAVRGRCGSVGDNGADGASPAPNLATSGGDSISLMQDAELTGLGGGISELAAPATDDGIAMMIQRLMIGGGKFSCSPAGPGSVALVIPGPLPNQVRAAYLNCAGDLFRPEDEERRRRQNNPG